MTKLSQTTNTFQLLKPPSTTALQINQSFITAPGNPLIKMHYLYLEALVAVYGI